eukprot:m.132144 g.132144  ORF g.132144 m.132144 type:complete len:727 (+) comp16841_c5_seq2:793-2973(+)
MFWKFGFHTPSALDSLLEQEDVTLERILDEEDVLQECKNQNKALTDFLSREEIISQMLQMVTVEPSEELDLKARFKYPSVACEVLTSDCWAILDAFTQPAPLAVFWGVIDRPAPLHPLLASFFMKIAFVLLQKKPEETCQYIRQHPEILDKLLAHLASPALMDVVMRICCTDCGGKESTMQQWLCEEQHLLDKIVGLFDPSVETSSAVVYNAAQLLEDLVNYARKDAMEMQQFAITRPFITLLQREEVIGRLLDYSLAGSANHLEHGIRVLLALVNEPSRTDEEPQPSQADAARHVLEVKNVLGVVAPRMEQLNMVLVTPPSGNVVTPSGVMAPVGSVRIMILRLLQALVSSNNIGLNTLFANLGTAATCLDLFFNYPHNNFVHRHVSNLVSAVFANPMIKADEDSDSEDDVVNPIIPCLLRDGRLLSRSAEAWAAAPTDPAQTRPGYFGHLVVIANAVEAARKKDPAKFRSYLEPENADPALAAWLKCVDEHVKPQNELFSSVLGGQRPARMLSDDSDDDALYGTDEQTTAAEIEFGQYFGLRISGDLPASFAFHSSKDDTEEEDLLQQYGQDGPFADSVGFQSDFPDMDVTADAQGVQGWQIVDGPSTPDELMDDDEWQEQVIADQKAATSMKISVDDASSSGSDSETDLTDASPQSSPRKPVDIPLSPRGAAAVSSMPSLDPFSASGSAPEESGWANFGNEEDAPQAMDVSGGPEELDDISDV